MKKLKKIIRIVNCYFFGHRINTFIIEDSHEKECVRCGKELWVWSIYTKDDYEFEQSEADAEEQALNIPVVMPRISHFTDENGNNVDICAGGVNVRLKRDGTHEYWRSYGFAGVMKLTPIYVA